MNKQLWVACRCLVLVCIVSAGGACADSFSRDFYTRGEDVGLYLDQGGAFDPSYVEVGPWAIIPRVTLGSTWEDNYYVQETDGEDSLRVDLTPGATLLYGRPNHNTIHLDVGVVVPLYHSVSNLDGRISYLVDLGGSYFTGRTRFDGRAGYRRFEEVNPVVGQRLVETVVLGSVGAEHRISAKSAVAGNGVMEFHDYDEDSYVDYRRDYLAASLLHQVTPKSDVLIQGGLGRDNLEQQQRSTYGDSDYADVSIGIRARATAKSSLSGSVGYRWHRFDDATLDDVSSWIGRLEGRTTPFAFSTFTAAFVSDIRPDITGTSRAVSDRELSAGVNRRLFSERLRGGANVRYGVTRYYGNSSLADDEYWGYTLGLDWWAWKDFSMGVNYSHTERDSTETRSVYEADRVTARLSWNY